jgi:hypothetical protein
LNINRSAFNGREGEKAEEHEPMIDRLAEHLETESGFFDPLFVDEENGGWVCQHYERCFG